jgi:hypothetical protein
VTTLCSVFAFSSQYPSTLWQAFIRNIWNAAS